MSMDYLRSIEYVKLPFRVTDERAIECVHVLAAAKLVDVTFVSSGVPGIDRAADIEAITERGRVALAYHAQGKPLPWA